jgi:2-oxoglutarate ferredoxin oxidoreductase subunit delta
MPKVEININKCKGCAICITACPKDILQISETINKMGYNVAECIDDDACILCKSCAIVCPDMAITLNKPEA